MLKRFRDKKKNNKGFTLVELVVVVAILAILVGLLAPQYTKYVEKSRKAADASNLDNLVKGLEVAAADGEYQIDKADYEITIGTAGTTINVTNGISTSWRDALKEYTGFTFEDETVNDNIKLKSSKWTGDTIKATVKVKDNGAVSVTYNPESLKDQQG